MLHCYSLCRPGTVPQSVSFVHPCIWPLKRSGNGQCPVRNNRRVFPFPMFLLLFAFSWLLFVRGKNAHFLTYCNGMRWQWHTSAMYRTANAACEAKCCKFTIVLASSGHLLPTRDRKSAWRLLNPVFLSALLSAYRKWRAAEMIFLKVLNIWEFHVVLWMCFVFG